MIFDDEFGQMFRRMSKSFEDIDRLFEDGQIPAGRAGPLYYGYSMTVGPDGRPVIKEYGNIRPGLPAKTSENETLVDTLVDEKEKLLKLVAEMPGVEKSDFEIVVDGKTVNIDAERGERKYHTKVPVEHKIDQDSVVATYKNGILEVTFKLLEPEKPKGKTVEVR